MVVTYCLFEPKEILRCKYSPIQSHNNLRIVVVCFFVFDQDKHGYFESSELKMLMNILHRVEKGDTVKVCHIDMCVDQRLK
jgi:hypothetical protein